MDITLTPEQDQFVHLEITSGRYGSANEVVGEALRLLEGEKVRRAHELAAFQEELQERLDSLDRGEGIPGEVVEAQMREFLAKLRQERA